MAYDVSGMWDNHFELSNSAKQMMDPYPYPGYIIMCDDIHLTY